MVLRDGVSASPDYVQKEDNRQQLGDHWNEACEAARLDLITCLKSAVDGPLAYPNFAVPFRIAVDGCQDPGGIGSRWSRCSQMAKSALSGMPAGR